MKIDRCCMLISIYNHENGSILINTQNKQKPGRVLCIISVAMMLII